MSFKGSDDDEELEMVHVINQNNNNNYNVENDSESKCNDEENLLDKDVDKEVEDNPMTTFNAKVVQAMKAGKALYNNYAK